MKETTLLNNINKLVDKINYESIYVEIRTKNDKYILEKNNERKIGFEIERKEYKKSKDIEISNLFSDEEIEDIIQKSKKEMEENYEKKMD